jgi:indolepyruvate ferredoxin oxidoreductase, beta subunit
MKKNKNIVIVGVGGQGIILSSKIISELALSNGLDIKQSEVHGMSQRGGSVISYVRYGKKVYSPLIEKGAADILIAFEKVEALRYADYLNKDSIVVLNDYELPPVAVALGYSTYPSNINNKLKSITKNLYSIKASDIASEIGTIKITNVIILGLLSNFLEFDLAQWKKKLKSMVPSKFYKMNLKGFEIGRNFLDK